MKKLLKNSLTLLLTCCILVSMLCFPALAANGNIYFSDPSVIVGNNVNVSVTVGDAISMCDILLSYNTSELQFLGGSGSMEVSGGGGTIHLNGYNGSGAGSFSCTLSFKALAVSSSKITVSYYDLVDDNGDNVVGHIGSAVVTVSNPPTASSDATLKALTISPGTLSPSFSSGTTNYTATVSSSTTKLNVSATKNDSKASVSVSGTNLSVGSNKVTVTVTAEDGTKKTYTITVTRPAETTTPDSGNNPGGVPETDVPETSEEIYLTLVNGGVLEVSPEIDEEQIPAGFILAETTVEDKTVDAITCGENTDPAVWLKGDDNNPEGFYFINEDGLGYPMVTLKQPKDGIIILNAATFEVPDGHILGKFTIGEDEYDAYILDNGMDPEYCLIYGINAAGETVLYCYDPADGTFQKHGLASVIVEKEIITEVEKEVIKEVEVTVEVPVEPEYTSLASHFNDKRVFWISVGAGVIVLALIVLCIMFAYMYARKNKACKLMASKRSFNTAPLPKVEE